MKKFLIFFSFLFLISISITIYFWPLLLKVNPINLANDIKDKANQKEAPVSETELVTSNGWLDIPLLLLWNIILSFLWNDLAALIRIYFYNQIFLNKDIEPGYISVECYRDAFNAASAFKAQETALFKQYKNEWYNKKFQKDVCDYLACEAFLNKRQNNPMLVNKRGIIAEFQRRSKILNRKAVPIETLIIIFALIINYCLYFILKSFWQVGFKKTMAHLTWDYLFSIYKVFHRHSRLQKIGFGIVLFLSIIPLSYCHARHGIVMVRQLKKLATVQNFYTVITKQKWVQVFDCQQFCTKDKIDAYINAYIAKARRK